MRQSSSPAAPPATAAPYAERLGLPWWAWPLGLAAAAHQGFSANLFTLTSDMFPRAAVASVVGIGGFAGAMGGFFMNLGAGWLRESTGSYAAMFIMAGGAYLAALLVIHLLAPRLEPARLDAVDAKA